MQKLSFVCSLVYRCCIELNRTSLFVNLFMKISILSEPTTSQNKKLISGELCKIKISEIIDVIVVHCCAFSASLLRHIHCTMESLKGIFLVRENHLKTFAFLFRDSSSHQEKRNVNRLKMNNNVRSINLFLHSQA